MSQYRNRGLQRGCASTKASVNGPVVGSCGGIAAAKARLTNRHALSVRASCGARTSSPIRSATVIGTFRDSRGIGIAFSMVKVFRRLIAIRQ